MQKRYFATGLSLMGLLISSLLLSSCQNFDPSLLLGSAALPTGQLTDQQVRVLSAQSCQRSDRQQRIAPVNSGYNKRLKKIAISLGNNLNGLPLNYQVYLTKQVNAWAMANGCIRVYSGLMDLMNDNEVRAVLGHEIGHVALGHTRHAMQVAYATQAVRIALASAGGVIGQLSASQLGALGEQLINAQFSQQQEEQADAFSVYLLKRRGLNPNAMVTSLQKLERLPGGQRSSLFDSHPATQERIARVEQIIAQRD